MVKEVYSPVSRPGSKVGNLSHQARSVTQVVDVVTVFHRSRRE
jgi:hypothetical protein